MLIIFSIIAAVWLVMNHFVGHRPVEELWLFVPILFIAFGIDIANGLLRIADAIKERKQ